MTTLNCYATLADYKTWIAVRGLGGSVNPDGGDDVAIELILKGASRYIDKQSGRRPYPTVETRYYDVPERDAIDPREIKLDADLLEVLSLTNGDGVAIPSTEYNLRPRNQSPYRYIRLKDLSTYYWTSDASGNRHDVIAISGIWGYHDKYDEAWETITTAAEALDASELEYDVTDANGILAGNLARFDNEFGFVSSIDTNTLTLRKRGENGSAAATHETGINVKVWQVMDDIKTFCLQIAQSVYGARSGQSSAGKITVTAAGVVIRPEEVPPMVQKGIENLRRRT